MSRTQAPRVVRVARADGAERTALWYTPVSDVGGVARHVLDAARAGIPGWRLVVLCPEGPLAVQLRELGVAVVIGAVSPADGARTAVTEVRRVLARLRPDVLHTHLAFADIAGAAAVTGARSGRGRRIRVVSTEHGIAGVRGYYQSGKVQARVRSSMHRARLRRTDVVIAVAESTREQVLAQWGRGAPVRVVRNGVDAPEPAAQPQPGLRVLSLARLAREKRIDHLLRAFALVHTERPEATLTVAGTGDEEQALRALARELGVESAVTFPGHVDANNALRQHDVVVQLSAWENLSYTLLDAVAHGAGVVATDVGGNREIVPERCLVEAEDHASVARHIIEQGDMLASRPRLVADEHDVYAMCRRIGAVYDEVAA